MLAMPPAPASTATRWRPRSRASCDAFVDAFGRAPDFIDGHQHVHLFPQVSDAVLDVVKAEAPGRLGAAMRTRDAALGSGLRDRKGLLLDMLSTGFRRRGGGARRAHQSGIRRHL